MEYEDFEKEYTKILDKISKGLGKTLTITDEELLKIWIGHIVMDVYTREKSDKAWNRIEKTLKGIESKI